MLRQQIPEYHPHHDPHVQTTSHSKMVADKVHLINNDLAPSTSQLAMFGYGYPGAVPYHKELKVCRI